MAVVIPDFDPNWGEEVVGLSAKPRSLPIPSLVGCTTEVPRCFAAVIPLPLSKPLILG